MRRKRRAYRQNQIIENGENGGRGAWTERISSPFSIGSCGAACLAGVLAGATVQSVLWGDEAEVIGPGVGFLVIGAGIFLAWLGQMRLYAYGKIAESCEAMMKTMERMEAMQRAQLPVRKCANCGAVLDDDAFFCTKCGTRIEK